MSKKQQGFTLIELVAVIVILGALAVVALPRFINLQDEAREAALDGVVGAANSAHAVNLAGVLASDAEAVYTVDNCDDTPSLMQGTVDGYSFTAGGLSANNGTGTTTDCVVEQEATNATAAYTAYYVSE